MIKNSIVSHLIDHMPEVKLLNQKSSTETNIVDTPLHLQKKSENLSESE
jgi:hypothetical protein